MLAVLHGGTVEYVIYMGMSEKYPKWFKREVLDDISMDAHRYTTWLPREERPWDYYEKTLVENFSVFIKKENGDLHCTDYDIFTKLYKTLSYFSFTNSGTAAYKEDCIDCVILEPGVLCEEYPNWFYEFFTESVTFPNEDESILVYDLWSYGGCKEPLNGVIKFQTKNEDKNHILTDGLGYISIYEKSVFLKNKFGEIRHMDYVDFIRHYDLGPDDEQLELLDRVLYN